MDGEHQVQLDQIERACRNLWAVVMNDLWQQGDIPFPALMHWATLRPPHGRSEEEAFPLRDTAVPGPGFQWTLSICSLAEMNRYRNMSFGQLVARLTLVLPLHHLHSSALPILEVMLHSIGDSEPEDLLSLETLLMTIWETSMYVRSDDHDICECRLIEVILRGADHRGRYWAGLESATARWDVVAAGQRSVIYLAYRSWVGGIEDLCCIEDYLGTEHPRDDRSAEVISLPSHLSRLTKSYATTGYRRRIHGVEAVERLVPGDRSKPRTILAGDLFLDTRVYFVYDLSKQEVIMFRPEEARYSLDSATLTLPERFGHHHICVEMINLGYTTDMGGTFKTPKPFILKAYSDKRGGTYDMPKPIKCASKYFVCDHMSDIFDADHMR